MKKLEHTQQIHIDTTLRVYKKGFGYSILKVIVNHELFLAAQSTIDFINAIMEGDKVEAYLWVEDTASFEFTLMVIGRIPGDPHILFFKHTEDIFKSEERKCLGAQTRLPMKFFILHPGDAHKSFSTEKVVFHEGLLIWIEDREAIIKTDFEMPDDVLIRGHIQIDDVDTELMGKMTLINKEKNIYNMLFSGVQEDVQLRILDYIFKTYRE